jgi:hypothetical protein
MTTATTPLSALPFGDCLLKLKGAALYLGVSVWTLRRWGDQGLIEPPLRIGSGLGKPYYALSTLQAFISRQRPAPAQPTAPRRPAA